MRGRNVLATGCDARVGRRSLQCPMRGRETGCVDAGSAHCVRLASRWRSAAFVVVVLDIQTANATVQLTDDVMLPAAD